MDEPNLIEDDQQRRTAKIMNMIIDSTLYDDEKLDKMHKDLSQYLDKKGINKQKLKQVKDNIKKVTSNPQQYTVIRNAIKQQGEEVSKNIDNTVKKISSMPTNEQKQTSWFMNIINSAISNDFSIEKITKDDGFLDIITDSIFGLSNSIKSGCFSCCGKKIPKKTIDVKAPQKQQTEPKKVEDECFQFVKSVPVPIPSDKNTTQQN